MTEAEPTAAAAKVAASASVAADVVAADRKNSINRLWEITQAFLAISLTISTEVLIVVLALRTHVLSDTLALALFMTLPNAWFMVLGFYFGRTNHSRPTPTQPFGGSTQLGPE